MRCPHQSGPFPLVEWETIFSWVEVVLFKQTMAGAVAVICSLFDRVLAVAAFNCNNNVIPQAAVDGGGWTC